MDGVREVAGNSDRCIRATSSVEVMAEKLRKLRVTHLIGCVEHSMLYAEQLCAQMGLPSNGLRLSEARRNKALMIETLRKAAIRVPIQFETDQLPDLLAWAQVNQYPVVLKPVSSGGTDNVYLCHSNTDIADNFHKVLGAKNFTGAINTSVLAQECVDGIEYIIDCVSLEGVHSSVAFFEYQKGTHNGRAFIYEKVRFLRSDNPVCQKLRGFAYRVLDELEVRDGPSHMEVKINSRGEVVFIEVGARLSGGESYRLVQEARADGKSQVQYVLDAIQGLPLPSADYETAKGVVRVCIISEVEGRLKSFRSLESIRALRSFSRLELSVEIGQMVSKTTDLNSLAGYIELVEADPSILAEDEKRLDEILSQGVLLLE
jgi:L-amino acid ligase